MARAASVLSPTTRRIRPMRVFLKAQNRKRARAAPMKNSTLILSAAWICGVLDQPPSWIEGSFGATGWMKDLPRKNAMPRPNCIMAMPMAMSLTFGNLQIQPWMSPKIAPATIAASTPRVGELVMTATA